VTLIDSNLSDTPDTPVTLETVTLIDSNLSDTPDTPETVTLIDSNLSDTPAVHYPTREYDFPHLADHMAFQP